VKSVTIQSSKTHQNIVLADFCGPFDSHSIPTQMCKYKLR